MNFRTIQGVLAPLIPYIAISIGLLLCRNAWIAMLGYHAGVLLMVRYGGFGIPVRQVFQGRGYRTLLIGAAIGAGGGLLLYALWPLLGVTADIQPYLEMARSKESKIRYIIDSHSHADHVSGGRLLAEATGGELMLPELADINYEATRVQHGDLIRMGGVGIEIVHVPGHRPEQINALIYDYPRGDEPWFILTADFVMVGDVARPDLAQAGDEGAPVLFDVAIPRFLGLPDHVEVYPGHLAGST